MRIRELLLSFFVAAPVVAATVHGRVIDLGAIDVQKNGLDGVTVVVYDEQQKPVGDPVATSADGTFDISNLPVLTKAVVVYTKSGYQYSPYRVRSVKIDGDTRLEEVEMTEMDAPPAYNRRVARRILAADATARVKYLQLVSALPAEQRASLETLVLKPTEFRGRTLLSGDAIPGVTVTLLDCTLCPDSCDCASWQRTTITEANGEYKFGDLLAGKYALVTELEGMQRKKTPIEVRDRFVVTDVPMNFAKFTEAIAPTARIELTIAPKQPVVFVRRGCREKCGHAYDGNNAGRITAQLPAGVFDIFLPGQGNSPARTIDTSSFSTMTIDVSRP